MRIQLSALLKEEFDRQALDAMPYEACGLLLGQKSGRVLVIRNCIFSKNMSANDKRRSFEIDPELYLKLQRETRNRPIGVVGVWHSHPNGVANLSETDKAMSVEPGWIWLVSAVQEDDTPLKAFIADEKDSHIFKTTHFDLS